MNKNKSNLKKLLIKYNEDDILEILTEYLAVENGFGTFNSRAVLLGEPNKDLRLVAVIGELEDETVYDVDLSELDSNMNFNGSHTE